MAESTVFAKRMKEAREKAGLKQNGLAKKVGVTPQTISAYEKAGKAPTLENAVAIAKELGVSLDWLCGMEPVKPTNTHLSYGSISKTLTAMFKEGLAEFSQVVYMAGDVYNIQEVLADSELKKYKDDFGFTTIPRIEITDDTLAKFVNGWIKMSELCGDGTIDNDLFQSWLQNSISALDNQEFYEE